jgi:hypothetical protein
MLLKLYYEQIEVREKWLHMTNNKHVSTKCHVEDYSVLHNED